MATLILSLLYFFLAAGICGKCSSGCIEDECCPPWMIASGLKCGCRDLSGFHRAVLFCDMKTDITYVGAGTCVSLVEGNGSYGEETVAVGDCQYSPISKKSQVLKNFSPLSNNRSSINSTDIMCGLFNRQGLLCSSCLPGYGVSVYSYGFPCTKCNEHHFGVLWYLLLEFAPITLFYIIVLLFRIRATAAPLTGLVFFSHNILNLMRGRVALYTSLAYSTNAFTYTLLQIGLFLCSIWNLDFFRFLVPPFCVRESIGNIYAVVLEYVSALYPLLLVLITFFIIELHARNVRLIVWLYKPFHICFVHFRRTWDIKRSIINAFSTFLLLSYSKAIVVSFRLLYRTSVFNIDGEKISTLLQFDPKITYFGREHAPFAVMAVIIIIMLVLPIVLLVLYPMRLFQKCIGRCQCRATHTVHMFVDTYQGCLKDGTNGTRDYRAVSAIYLILRFILLSLYTQSTEILLSGLTLIIFGIIFMLLTVLLGTFKPYKANYMTYTESFLLFLYGVILMLIYIWLYVPSSEVITATLLVIAFLIPHIALISYILIRLLQRKITCQWVKSHWKESYNRICGKDRSSSCTTVLQDPSNGDFEESLPDRLNNPDTYAFSAVYQLESNMAT